MNRMEVFGNVLNILMMEYNLDDLNEYDEAVKCTDLLIERSGENVTIEEIRKCLYNRYDDYLY